MTDLHDVNTRNDRRNLGCIPSKWDDRNLRYAVRSPAYNEILSIPETFEGLVIYAECLGNQGNIGSCTGWAGAGLMAVMIRLNDGRAIRPSAGWIYAKGRAYCDPPLPENSEGSYPIAAMKLLQKEGATTEECSPTDTTSPFELVECPDAQSIASNYKIGSYHQVQTDPASIKSAIYGLTYTQPYTMPSGLPGQTPLYIAIPVYSGLYQAVKGVVGMPKDGDALYGYHAVLIIGWTKINSGDYWIIVNSWGKENGNNGFYYLPIGYPITEAWLVTDDAPIPNDTPIPPPPVPEPQPEPHPPPPAPPVPPPAPVPPQPGPQPEPIPPKPSPCKWGNNTAKAMNLLTLQSFRKRKGRFFYLNNS